MAEQLRSEGSEVLFVGSRRGVEARVVPDHGYPIHFVCSRGLSRQPLEFLRALAATFCGIVQSVSLLTSYRPDLVVGTGGYVSAPAVLAAALLRVPIVLLEQNAVPGKATRFLSKWADQVCLSFPQSESMLTGRKVTVTGNPVRPALLGRDKREARGQLGLDCERLTLLVTGASQGAASLNRAVLKSLSAWQDRDWTVLHLTGRREHEAIKQKALPLVKGQKLHYRALDYLDDIGVAYTSADLVVSRAGATTIAELTCLGLPALLVPYPFAEGHQKKNAEAMNEAGAGVVVEDSDIEEKLGQWVERLFEEPQTLVKMAQASRQLGQPEAVTRIAHICESLARTGRTIK